MSRLAREVVVILLTALLAFLALEGLASTVVVAKLLCQPAGILAENMYTRYDPDLGWVSIPKIHLPNMYGPGVFLRMNSQGFRGDRDCETHVPLGKVRVVCSGDSFTLGYGVDDDSTWSRVLERMDPRLETVNMGQGGYGIDQAYLWYMRDGIKLDHDIHVFGFISSDVHRTAFKVLGGYPKPTLGLRQGELVVRNVPVPQLDGLMRFRQRLTPIQNLRAAVLLRSILEKRAQGPFWNSDAPDPGLIRLVAKVFDRLSDTNNKKNSVLVVTCFPTQGDCARGSLNPIEAAIRAETKKLGVHWVDLLDDFLKLPPPQLQRMFISEVAIPNFLFAAGHYTVEGNDFVARLLYDRLHQIPEVAARLAKASSPRLVQQP